MATLALRELMRLDSAPLRVIAAGAGMELTLTREAADEEFSSVLIRSKLTPDLRAAVSKLISESKLTGSLETTAEEDEICLRAEEASVDELHPLLQQLSSLLHIPETWRVRGEGHCAEYVSPDGLFQIMQQTRASDMHLLPGSPPVVRRNTRLQPVADFPPLSAHQILEFVREIAPAEHWERFRKDRQCSFRYHQLGRGYSRVSAFLRVHAPHCTLRYLPDEIPSFGRLQLPASIMEQLANHQDGLILVTGMTGSGKSTTVAALLNWINVHKALHILTIEDPIEYIHRNRQSLVSQREAGSDFVSFTEAVRGALRQDPDVMFVGEMRDADTIRAVIDAAATGHLVISTLHASTAASAGNRIAGFFEPAERDLVRNQLHECLRCVISQRLVPTREDDRVPALEFLFNDTKQISDSLLRGDARGVRLGMQQTFSESKIFEESLLELYRAERITEEVASTFAPHPETLEQMKLGTWRPPSLDSMANER